jgi:AraC-like DNA-binding protein
MQATQGSIDGNATPKPGKERVRFWRDADLGGLEFLEADYPDKRFPMHFHDEYVMGTIEQGVETFFVRGRIVNATRDTLILLNPGDTHNGYGGSELGWRYRTLYPSEAFVRAMFERIYDRSPRSLGFMHPVLDRPDVVQGCRRLHIASQSQRSKLEKETAAVALFASLFRELVGCQSLASSGYVSGRAFARLKEHLIANVHDNVSLDDLSKISGLSACTVIRIFKKNTGLSPHAYLKQARLRQAMQDLRIGRSVVDVAMERGFYDQAHLSRAFKQVYGLTPAVFASQKPPALVR